MQLNTLKNSLENTRLLVRLYKVYLFAFFTMQMDDLLDKWRIECYQILQF